MHSGRRDQEESYFAAREPHFQRAFSKAGNGWKLFLLILLIVGVVTVRAMLRPEGRSTGLVVWLGLILVLAAIVTVALASADRLLGLRERPVGRDGVKKANPFAPLLALVIGCILAAGLCVAGVLWFGKL